MPAVSTVDCLELWERAAPVPPVRRAPLLLGALPDSPPGEATGLPVGRRDALLLDLYADTFGDALDGLATCPACGTVVELTVSCAALRAAVPPAVPAEAVDFDGHAVTWRCPDSADLAAIVGFADVEAAARELLDRCVLDAPVPAAELPEAVREMLTGRMAGADPYAELAFELCCPECGYGWSGYLDVAGFVWARVQERAGRLLGAVDTLARAYGWSEAEVLGLSEARRAAYLRLAADG
jgi:hypothetical protein